LQYIEKEGRKEKRKGERKGFKFKYHFGGWK
jgi:hypothetical protein